MSSEFSSPSARARAYFDMLIADYGIFRIFYRNFHQIAPGVYRSNQPSPFQIGQAAKMGIRTIVNLRGVRSHNHYLLEKTACRKHGIRLVNFLVRSRDVPRATMLHHTKRLFNQLEYPVLFHCKSGADRVGFMSVLYLYLQLGTPLEEAMQQLSMRYGHFRYADTGVLDRFFETYLEHRQKSGQDFFTWIDHAYDPQAMKRDFRARAWSRGLVNFILRRE